MAANHGIHSSFRRRARSVLLAFALVAATVFPAMAGATSQNERVQQSGTAQKNEHSILIKLTDENGVAVQAAMVTITPVGGGARLKSETDYAGKVQFGGLATGSYEVKIAKEGFYEKTLQVQSEASQTVEAVLDHLQELKEVMDVVYSAPAIDPEKTSTTQDLTAQEIIDLPYKTGRDIKNAFPLMPGIVQDGNGAFHVEGAQTRQTNSQLDGFDITQPETGTINLHLSADAVRSISAVTSGYSVEQGKGSGGVIEMNTGMGDNRYRFSATNFLPSAQNKHGVNLNDWTPRATFSGPIRKDTAWFFDAADGQYKLNIVDSLPRGQDTDPLWEISNLAKTQINLTESNILSGGYLLNRFREEHNGLTRFSPVDTTVDLRQSADMFYARDLAYLRGGALLESGVAYTRYDNQGVPHGMTPFLITPDGNRGNYFKNFNDRSSRLQWLTSLVLPGGDWHGRHVFKAGFDFSRVSATVRNDRRPTFVLREDGTLAAETVFVGGSSFSLHNVELNGYGQDRWHISNRLLLEGGIRADHDQIIPGVSLSPRVASSILLAKNGETKLTAGIGLYHDATTLGLIERGLDAERVDLNFAPDGITPQGSPLAVSFGVNNRNLKRPRFLNWNIGLEKKLPGSLFLKLAFLEKRGTNGFAFINLGTPQPIGLTGLGLSTVFHSAQTPKGLPLPVVPSASNMEIAMPPLFAALPLPSIVTGAQFQLSNIGKDRYDAFEVTVRRTFKNGYEFLASYIRSGAHSNAVIDFSPDSPLFSQQAGGPFAWDTPNRFLTHGFLPLAKKFTVAYRVELRDGYPFTVFDQEQQILGPPNSRRYPYYFSLDLHVERRVSFLGYNLAIRGGFDDITGRANPNAVNSNIDSPKFLTFGAQQRRAFTARIRFLGKK